VEEIDERFASRDARNWALHYKVVKNNKITIFYGTHSTADEINFQNSARVEPFYIAKITLKVLEEELEKNYIETLKEGTLEKTT